MSTLADLIDVATDAQARQDRAIERSAWEYTSALLARGTTRFPAWACQEKRGREIPVAQDFARWILSDYMGDQDHLITQLVVGNPLAPFNAYARERARDEHKSIDRYIEVVEEDNQRRRRGDV